MSEEKTKYCDSCKKNVIPESRKIHIGGVFGFDVKEKYCPECNKKLTQNTRYAWIICCFVVLIAFVIVFIIGGIQS